MATLEELEERLFEQEHRPVAAIKNFIMVRPALPKGDPRRRAIAFSLFWSLFFSPGGVAAVGSLVALATLGLLAWQNYLMRDANQLLLAQIQSEERVALQSQRLSAIRDLYGNESPVLRSEALLSLTTITGRLYEISPTNTHLIRKDLTLANLENCILDYKEVDAFDFSSANFKGARMNAGVFSHCIFNNAIFDQASLGCSFLNCTFDDMKLKDLASVENASFDGCTFTACDFTSFNAEGAEFRDCKFVDCKADMNSKFIKEGNVDARCIFKRLTGLESDEMEVFAKRTGATLTNEVGEWE